MNLHELLTELSDRNVKVWAEEDQLRIRAPKGALTPELRDSLTNCKLELLTLLHQQQSMAEATAHPLVPLPRNGNDLPLSFAQQRLWFSSQIPRQNIAYNISVALNLSGPLNLTVLERCLNEILRRHEALRTSFPMGDDSPVQKIAAYQHIQLKILDLTNLSEIEQTKEIRRLAAEEAQRPFDLASDLLVRVTLLQLGVASHVVLLTMHHIISDDWSIKVFIYEAAKLYSAFSKGTASPLPDLPVQYADFAYWQRGLLTEDVLEPHLTYWKQQLAGNLPVLVLPADRPRPKQPTFQGGDFTFYLSNMLTDDLKRLGREEGVTLFVILLTAFNILLYRYTEQEDILIGSPITDRTRPELEPLIGLFVNTLVLRSDLSNSPSVRELLKRVSRMTLEAYAHQDLPFEKLVEALRPERTIGLMPLFQVGFGLQKSTIRRPENSELEIALLDIDKKVAKSDLTMLMEETPQGLAGNVEYTTDLFEEATIIRMVDHFRTLLENLVRSPQQRIAELNLLTDSERRKLLRDWNDTHTEYSGYACVYDLFEAQVKRRPDTVAVIWEDQCLTYRELNVRANQLAHFLQKRGVGPEVLVGIRMKRSLDIVIGILGILKAGGAYVPIDPAYPEERLAFMLKDSGVRILLTLETSFNALPDHLTEIVCIDTAHRAISDENVENPVSKLNVDDLAYVIYTSGSSGQPKGTLIQHRGLYNLIMDGIPSHGLDVGHNERVLHLVSFSFDAATYHLFLTLCSGATLYLGSESAVLGGPDLAHLLRDQAITYLPLTPSMLATIPFEPLPDLRLISVGGEACPPELVVQWSQGREFLNQYGPTEATVCSVVAECVDSSKPLPIGRPIANTYIYILDHHLQPVPIGVPGEMYIGGDGVARGYLNNPELTAEKFIPDPFSGLAGARLYRTGDLVRYLPDGNIEYLGRIDHQVKLRGFRLELGEIETVLARHPAVKDAVLLVREIGGNDRRLVAYITPGQPEPPVIVELNGYLKERLPEYMLPSAYIILDAIPTTTNGKIDRSALMAHDISEGLMKQSYVAPRTSTERMLATLCAEILEIEQVGVHDNFFDLGGHSLLITQLLTRLRELFQIDLPLQPLFETPTIARWAEIISAIQRGDHSVASQEIPEIDLQQEASLDSAIYPETETPPIGAITSPKHIFFTGATGFLGAFLLSELLQHTDAAIYCLVRSGGEQDGAERIQQILESYALWQEHFTSRIIPVPGDLSQPLFGLSSERFDRLARRIETIYHSGALVNFVYPYSVLKAANVLGTQEVLRLACQHQAKPVHYVSTLSVFDSTAYSGKRIILEDEPLDHSEGLRDGYAQSKWVAEKLVIIARSRGLPVSIYRLGRVTGHSQTGIVNPDDLMSNMIHACFLLGSVPSQNLLVDMTPVDYVSQAITHLSAQPDSLGQVFHLVNPQPLHWNDIVTWICSYDYPLQQLPYDQWLEALMQHAMKPSENTVFQKLLPIFLDLEASSPEERPQRFDCRNTLNGLAGTSILCPPVDADLLGTYLSYFAIIQDRSLNSGLRA